MRYLLPTFIVLPILEMYVLIKVGGNLGALNTVLLVLLTALIGVALLRVQGFRTLMNAKNKLGMAQLPAEEIITGIFLAIGGALLLTPGFITDIFGFLCLIPSTRRIFLKLFLNNLSPFEVVNERKDEVKKDWIEGEFDKDK
ncbi:FxsA family protein [Gammaproteobacteria bacterium]|mgnify:FL=1|nr:FxsA family protein [Gammaproteobacteria bacterium]|tara:strand:+ start:4463 stop:4888 length:426 start_codon:yes stop_codon:yes gene_type:complete